MKTSVTILSALLLAATVVMAAEAKKGGRCCVVYSKGSQVQKLPLNLIKEYTMQDMTGSCRIPAVVFITQRDRRICANPKAKIVKRILKQLRVKKNKKQGARWRKVKE